ncbi:MAG TPA: acyltransferase [Planctomycetaceae bacterium]|nr:acyltransferase [Planctomycetaceae bacterium]
MIVVLFHAGLGFPGGFVGVDVFFVISGYLITSLILRDVNAGTFSLADFWERRIRRILPAVTVCVLLTLAAGWLLLLPSDLLALGESAVAQSLMVSNVYFWRTTNYFGGDIFEKPLLHTWSLSVEEQFYLFFPVLLILTCRFRLLRQRIPLVVLLGLLFSLSLVLSIWGVKNQPYATFYLLPTRAWELLTGSLLAASSMAGLTSSWKRETLAWLGLAGILAPAFIYDEQVPFPGLAALPPCLGAAAIIWANASQMSLAASLLSAAPVRFIGLISYSLYLYHWPVIVFTNYWKTTELSTATRLAMVLVSLVLATLSWRLIEAPFRRRSKGKRHLPVFATAVTALLIMLSIGCFLSLSQGYPNRLPPTALELVKSLEGEYQKRALFKCPLNTAPEEIAADRVHLIGSNRPIGTGPQFVVLGDSHAHLAAPLFERVANEYNVSGAVITHAATPPLQGWKNRDPHGAKDPSLLFSNSFEYVKRNNVKNVILMATWAKYCEESSYAELTKLLKDTISTFGANGTNVHLLMSPPIYRVNVPRVRLKQAFFDSSLDSFPYQSPQEHKSRQRAI